MSGDDLKPGEERFPEMAHLDPAALAAQKRRNIWLGIALLAFVILVGATTMVRLKASDPSKGSFYYHMNQGEASAPEARPLPPGMSPDQAAPPPNLSAEPPAPEQPAPEEPQR